MMKKHILNKFAIALIGVFMLTSCEEDFLEKVNPNQQSTTTFWRNNADLNSGLTTVYHALANDNLLALTNENNRSDLAYPGFNRLQSSNAFYNQTFTDGNGGIAAKWSALYAIVFRANQVIENAERLTSTYVSTEDIAEATQIIAQARLLRGWAYFTLHWMYNNGSVILFDFVPQNEEDFYQPLSDAATIRSFFLADLEYARENLPASWEEDANLGRVTAGTATTILGKNYLYENDYATAATFFQDVIENPDYGYSLVNNIEDNFSEAGEFNSESILEIGYSVIEKPETSGFSNANVSNRHNKAVAPAGGGGFRTIVPSAWLAVLYRNEKMDTTDDRNYVDSIASNGDVTRILRDFSLRTSVSVALPDDLDTPYYGGLTTPQVGNFNNLEYAYFRKYSNWRTVRRENDFQPDFKSPLNVRLIRLADVYLMYAECLIAGGTDESGVAEALTYINRIRRRSGVELLGLNGTGLFPPNDHDNINYNASTLMEHLMYIERPLELAMEGQATRFLDLRRWGITTQRFQDITSRDYYLQSSMFIREDGTMGTKFDAIINEGSVNPDTGEPDTRVKDHRLASQNYTPSIHDYYPVPNAEVLSNSNLFN